LVSAADRLSIAVCTELRDPAVRSDQDGEAWLRNVPTARDMVDLRILALHPDGTRFVVQPWPFAALSVRLVCEGIELPPIRFAEQDHMQAALRDARRINLMAELVPSDAKALNP
jgi:hypothetical protein